MRKWIATALLVAMPGIAQAASVDASLIPDGTYVVHVERVIDAKHMLIKLDNGMETTVTADRTNMSFDVLATNDVVKMSLIKGGVAVYAKQ